MPEEHWRCRTPGNCGVAPVVIDVEEVTPEERQRRRRSRRNGAALGVDVECDAGRPTASVGDRGKCRLAPGVVIVDDGAGRLATSWDRGGRVLLLVMSVLTKPLA